MADGRQARKGSPTPVELYQREIVPAIYEHPDSVFPDAGWKRVAGGWQATNREFSKARFGARPDRVMVYENSKHGLTVHGAGFATWISLIASEPRPTGRAFVEAVKELARRVGVDASVLDREPTPEETERTACWHRRQDILETYITIAQEALKHDAPQPRRARTYLEGRGFRPEDVQTIGFGLCPSIRDAKRYLTNAGITPEEIEESGLVSDGRWPARLVWAWRDRWGAVATLVARDVSGECEDAGQKYLYLARAHKPGFYGLDRLRKVLAAEPGRPVVIVEGLLDAEALRVCGFERVLALGGDGNQLSAARWEALTSLRVRAAVLCLDFDPRMEKCERHARPYRYGCSAGVQGTLAALDNLAGASAAPAVYVVDPRELHLAAGEPKDTQGGPAKVDPDSLVRAGGPEVFEAVVGKAVPGAVYRAEAFLAGVGPDSPHLEKEKAVLAVAGYIEHGLRGEWAKVHEDAILAVTAERTGYGPESLEPIFQAALERGRREALEKGLDAILKGAADARAEKAEAPDVIGELKTGLAVLEAGTLDAPPPFSVERLDRESRQSPAGKSSGWETVDRLEARFNPGELAIIAGRTGHCKTTVLVNLVANMLEAADREARDELLVLYSTEEPEVRIYHRLLAILTAKAGEGWSVNEVRDYLRDRTSRRFWPNPRALDDARELLRSREDLLLVVHRPAWTVDGIYAHARNLAETRTVGGVIVDYLQRIEPPEGRYDRRDVEVSAVARRLKALAVDVDVPVVAGAQINRQAVGHAKIPNGEYLDPKVQRALRLLRPKLHHLREGGSEQEGDLVAGLLNLRGDFETDESGDSSGDCATVPEITRLDFGILKNRYGTPGKWAALAFEGRCAFIRDPEPGELDGG